MKEKNWKEAFELLRKGKVVLLVTHVNPDPDAIGALLGLGMALREQGKNVAMFVDGGVPERLAFIQNSEPVRTVPDLSIKPDLVIALDGDDLASLGQCGAAAFGLGVPTLVIDHHAYNESYGEFNLVDDAYVSTTAIIFDLLEYLNWNMSSNVSCALLAGILSDTQLFRVGPISERTFNTVQVLMNRGANYARITKMLFSQVRTGLMSLLGYVTFTALLDDHVYLATVHYSDFAKFGLEPTNEIYVVDELLKDESAFVAASFIEVRPGTVKVSLRAMSGYDVGKIADGLGGGGHKLSAGYSTDADGVQEVVEKVLPLLRREANRTSK